MSCTTYPPTAAQPASTKVYNIIGWNAGGTSQSRLDGNLHTVFSLPSVAGVVCGFASPNSPESVPTFITHGFYFQKQSGEDFAIVIESGVAVGSAWARQVDDKFEVRRVFDLVEYFYNGSFLYRSKNRSSGQVVLSACLYMTGDAVG